MERLSPVRVPGLTGVTAIASDANHTVVVGQDGAAWAWGYDGEGQLGDGTAGYRPSPVRVIP